MPNTITPIRRLGSNATPEQVVAGLQADGAVIVEQRLSAQKVAALRSVIDPLVASSSRGSDDFYGYQTCRVGAMLSHTTEVHELATDELVLASARAFLGQWAHKIQLMLTQVIAIGPGETEQFLHRDRLAWGGFIPSDIEPQLNTMWAINDFTASNGATRIALGSAMWDDDREATPDEIQQAEMPAGSVLIFTGSVVHGGGANQTDSIRLGLNIDYCLDWLRQEENQYLTCPPEIAKTFSPELASLVGYTGGGLTLGYWTDPSDTVDRSIKQAETAIGHAASESGSVLTDAAFERAADL